MGKLGVVAFLLVAGALLVDVGDAGARPCPPGYYLHRGRCVPAACPVGYHRNPAGVCVRHVAACPVGYHRNPAGVCVRNVAACPVGYHRNPAGVCVRHAQGCPPGYYRNYRGFCVRR